ncbi:MAG: hypothetical protein NTZ33_00445 [Bacteroidetes bacterium]|nr:hypothetical protein [Bacteroidota bacterium]
MKKILFFTILLSAFQIHAQDRLFTYTYQSNVLNKGNKELEVWTTMRNSRDNYYRAFDHTLEFELGLGKNLQTAFYLNYGYAKGIETINNIQSLFSENNYSFANEWKLKLSDPVVNAFGSAIYLEYFLSPDVFEIETKLIFDKQMGNFVQAFNISSEFEFKNEFISNANQIDIEREKEVSLFLNYALSYKINHNFSLGFELLNKNVFEDNKWQYFVFSAGPCISYFTDGFWINLSCLPQFNDFKTNHLELNDNEKIQTRLIFSYAF